VLSTGEFPFAFDESPGTGATLGVVAAPGIVSGAGVDGALAVVVAGAGAVAVAGAAVESTETTGGAGLASVFELLRLHPVRASGKLTERRAMRN